MFFGLTNSPATFQTMMNDIFQDLISEGVVFGLLGWHPDLHRNNGGAWPSDTLGVGMTPAAQAVPAPQQVWICKDLNWVPRTDHFTQASSDKFSEDCRGCRIAHLREQEEGAILSKIHQLLPPVHWGILPPCRPLFDFTQNESKWHCDNLECSTFESIRERIVSTPILMFPDDSQPFWVEADSFNFATGAVLSQQSPADDKWHPVAYYSKSLNPVEWNYEIYDKEMLAIIQALEDWCHFLEGAWHKFEIWTDP